MNTHFLGQTTQTGATSRHNGFDHTGPETTPVRETALRAGEASPGKSPGGGAEEPGREGRDAGATLTPREKEVLRWVALGKRDREIGQILDISWRTVQKHVQNILEKLEVETRGAASAWWYGQVRD